jgi:hypothetical protein
MVAVKGMAETRGLTKGPHPALRGIFSRKGEKEASHFPSLVFGRGAGEAGGEGLYGSFSVSSFVSAIMRISLTSAGKAGIV